MRARWNSCVLAAGTLCLIGVVLAGPANAEQFKLDNNITRDTGLVRKDTSAGTFKRFSEAYKASGKPRIAIFLNRTLSDDVREWSSGQRVVVSGNGSVTRTTETAARTREETVKGPMAVSVQDYNGHSGERNGADEPYMWAFEDGFMQQFLRAGATLVDRATIMRLRSRTANQGIANDPIEVKKTETDALVTNTDVYVELLITKYPSAPTGYEFRAVAKEIKTGRILASATSLNWDSDSYRPKKVVTTSKGYEIVEDNRMPKVQDLSRDLAVDLMNSLISSWGTP